MHQRILLLVVFFLSAYQLIVAQGLWQDEAVLRKNETYDIGSSVIHTSSGETIILWEKGMYGCQGLYLRKLNSQGQPVWTEDVLLSNNYSTKWGIDIVRNTQNNIFIKWTEGNTSCIAKLNTDGLFLWQPVVQLNWDVTFPRIIPDNNGGLYIVASKYSDNGSYNLFCQRLTAEGQTMIPNGGVQLTNETAQVEPDDLKLASDNGLIIKYSYAVGNAINRKLMRMLANYTVDWQLSYNVHNPATWAGGGGGMTPADSNRVIVIWHELFSGIDNVYMQKFDEDGQSLFNPAILLSGNYTSSSIMPGFANDNQGSLYVGLNYGSSTGAIPCTLQKYNYNGVPQWQNTVLLPDSIGMYDPVPDNNGGCYVMFKVYHNNGSSYYDHFIQHVNSTGQILWPSEGIEVISHLPYSTSTVRYSFSDRLWFFWVNRYEDKQGLYFQTRDTDGQMISAPRLTVVEGLGGDVTLQGIITRQNDVLAYWLDTRDYTNSVYTHKLYYRIVQPDGSMNQPVDGTLLTEDISGYYAVKSVYLPNGNTVIIWSIETNGTYNICGQAVDAAGNVLWELGGRIFASLPAGSSISYLMVTNDNNDIYITWTSLHNSTQQRVFMQKVTDGQPVWNISGILIDTGTVSTNLINRSLYLEGRFLVIYEQLGSTGAICIRVLHFEQDGSLSPGWNMGGVIAASFNYNNQFSFTFTAAASNSNLYLFYYYNVSTNRHYYYSVLQPDGSLPVSQQLLINDAWAESDLCVDSTDGLAYILRLVPPDMSDIRYGYSKLADINLQPWGNTAQIFLDPGSLIFNTNLSIRGFSNGGYLVSWLGSADYTIYGGYINALGEYQSPFGGNELIEKCRDAYFTSQLNNEMYFVWNSFKAAYYTYYTKEIKMQNFANLSTVGNSDEVAVEPARLTCYPNPCTSVLQINIFSPSKGRAELAVYNLKGQKVTSLNDAVVDKGRHTFTWNGKDYRGKQVSSGIYYLRLADRQGVSAAKVLYLK